MPLTCNLDSKGKALRLISGIIVCIIGFAVAWGWAAGSADWRRWLIALVVIALGGFQIFEGWAWWCVVRAMGFKTPV